MTDNDKQTILRHIQEGQPLPKEYIYKFFADDEDVFLFWNGRKEEVTNSVLPFHSNLTFNIFVRKNLENVCGNPCLWQKKNMHSILARC